MEYDPPLFESAADRLVRAVVDDQGHLVGLWIEPELLTYPVESVAQAVFDAVTEAQAVAETEGAAMVDQRGLADALERANRDADRRLSELSLLVSDLARGAGGRR
jgi:hypothetical protein